MTGSIRTTLRSCDARRTSYLPRKFKSAVALDTDHCVDAYSHEAVCTVAAGRSADTPAACIERASMPGQRVARGALTTITEIANAAGLQAPMVTVIGPTAHAMPL